MKKTTTKPRKPTKQKRVSGYWRINSQGEAYYVKGYLRKKPKKRRAIHAQIVEPKQKQRTPPPIIPGFRYVYTINSVEPVERVAYTIRIVALVDFNYKYPMSFRPEEFDGKPALNAKHLQFYHTAFFTRPEGAYEDFRQKVPLMRAYGDIDFLDIQLVRVSGSGPLSEKHFRVIEEYDSPESVPYFKHGIYSGIR